MAVTILERPQGYILGDCVSATIDEQYGGYATVNKVAHGLSDGDYVFIESNIESYNGFWYVDADGTDYFRLRRYATDDYQAYIVDATITYCPATSTHGVSCVHLPITYRLRSNLFPTNEASTSRTISSFGNDNGYVALTLSGSIDEDPYPEPFEFIKISGATDEDLDGVYQIIEIINSTTITINLAYDSTYSFGSATVIRHYNNYTINVRVYGGLNSSHTWATKKPYELLATLDLIPDENNEVFFSISELLKSKVSTKNNLTLDTLPLNLDAFTQFYISVAESYDDSLGSSYAVGTYQSSFTSDQSNFEGMAVNAKLPFKNQYSGHLTEYICESSSAKFLTLFDSPILFDGAYTDISFINYGDKFTPVKLRQTYYLDDTEQTTTDITISDYDAGVYRVQLTDTDCSHDRIDITVIGEEIFQNPSIDSDLTGWTTESGYDGSGTSYDWIYNAGNLGARNQIDVTSGASTDINSNRFVHDYFKVNSDTASTINYTIRWTEINIAGTVTEVTFYIEYYKNGVLQGSQDIEDIVASFNVDVTNSFVTNQTDFDEIKLRWRLGRDASLDSAVFFFVKDFSPVLQQGEISETKQFEPNCDCANQSLNLSWINYLGGFEYWTFTAEKEYTIDIEESNQATTNIFPSWPSSYGKFADTITKQTFKRSRNGLVVRSQYVTEAQLDAIKYIKTSPLVQIITSRTDRRTVIVDSDSFTVKRDRQDLYDITFNLIYTDEIPSQRV